MRLKFIVLLFASCIATVIGMRWRRAPVAAGEEFGFVNAGVRVVSVEAIPARVRSLRPVLPYSVLPGGVFSREELRHRLQSDLVARQHYADFQTNNAWLVSVTRDQLQYVSYREGNDIYWTKKRLRIPQGEVLITDGVHFARTRCGNLLSATPRVRVLSKEPTRSLDVPLVPEPQGDALITVVSPPDIPVPSDRPPDDEHREQIFAPPLRIGSPHLPPPNSTPVPSTPGFYFFGPGVGSTKQIVASGGVPPGASGGPGQLIPPPNVLIPEPALLMPVAIAIASILLWAARFKKRVPPELRC